MTILVEPSIPEYWRGINARFRLEGSECVDCGQRTFPPRFVCPKCKSTKSISNPFSGRGILRSYTIVHEAPKGLELHIPYIMGLVELEEGPIITAQIVDVNPEELKIGLELDMVFRKISEGGRRGIVRYGFKFGPIKYPPRSSNP